MAPRRPRSRPASSPDAHAATIEMPGLLPEDDVAACVRRHRGLRRARRTCSAGTTTRTHACSPAWSAWRSGRRGRGADDRCSGSTACSGATSRRCGRGRSARSTRRAALGDRTLLACGAGAARVGLRAATVTPTPRRGVRRGRGDLFDGLSDDEVARSPRARRREPRRGRALPRPLRGRRAHAERALAVGAAAGQRRAAPVLFWAGRSARGSAGCRRRRGLRHRDREPPGLGPPCRRSPGPSRAGRSTAIAAGDVAAARAAAEEAARRWRSATRGCRRRGRDSRSPPRSSSTASRARRGPAARVRRWRRAAAVPGDLARRRLRAADPLPARGGRSEAAARAAAPRRLQRPGSRSRAWRPTAPPPPSRSTAATRPRPPPGRWPRRRADGSTRSSRPRMPGCSPAARSRSRRRRGRRGRAAARRGRVRPRRAARRDEAERELRRLGHRGLHRRTRPGTADSGVESLTERELQVAGSSSTARRTRRSPPSCSSARRRSRPTSATSSTSSAFLPRGRRTGGRARGSRRGRVAWVIRASVYVNCGH